MTISHPVHRTVVGGGDKGKMDGGGLTPGYRKGWLHQEGVWEAEGGTKTASETTTTNALRG